MMRGVRNQQFPARYSGLGTTATALGGPMPHVLAFLLGFIVGTLVGEHYIRSH